MAEKDKVPSGFLSRLLRMVGLAPRTAPDEQRTASTEGAVPPGEGPTTQTEAPSSPGAGGASASTPEGSGEEASPQIRRSYRSYGSVLRNQRVPRTQQQIERAAKEKELEAARIQLARLTQRYNMVASHIQGSTRRKLLLRSIRRKQLEIEALERSLKTMVHS